MRIIHAQLTKISYAFHKNGYLAKWPQGSFFFFFCLFLPPHRYNTYRAIFALFYNSYSIILLFFLPLHMCYLSLSLSLSLIRHHVDGLSLPVIPNVPFPFRLCVALLACFQSFFLSFSLVLLFSADCNKKALGERTLLFLDRH